MAFVPDVTILNANFYECFLGGYNGFFSDAAPGSRFIQQQNS